MKNVLRRLSACSAVSTSGPLNRSNETLLLRNHLRSVVLGDYLFCVIFERARLRKQVQSLDDLGIVFRANLQAFVLPELVYEDFALDAVAEPVIVLDQILLGVGNLLFIEKFPELLHQGVVDREGL